MKLLASADIHGVDEVYDWLIRTAERRMPDAVLLAGDLLGGFGEEDTIEEAHAREANALAERLSAMPCPVHFIMGNDDMAELPPLPGRLIPVHGRRVELPPYNVVGYRYSLPFIGRETEKPEEEIGGDLRLLRESVDSRTVLVTHSPPFGVLDIGILDRHAGSTSLLQLIEERRPRAHVFGHIHRCAGREGRCWNVAASGTRRAVWIDLESLEDEVLGPE